MAKIDPEDLDEVDVALIVKSNEHFHNAVFHFEQAIKAYLDADSEGERKRVAFVAICEISKEFGAVLTIELIKGEPSIN